MKKRITQSLVLVLIGLWCAGFVPGFVTSRDIQITGDASTAIKALEHAVVEMGAKIEDTSGRENHWFSVDPGRIGFAAESHGTHISIGFDPKRPDVIRADISCATLEGCSGRRVLRNGVDGWVGNLVHRASEESGIPMALKSK